MKDSDNNTVGECDYYCGYAFKRSAQHSAKSVRSYCDQCLQDKNMLDELLENAQVVIRKRVAGERMKHTDFKASRIQETHSSATRLKKPEIPCLPYKQYLSVHGNPNSKENKRKGHKVGYAAGIKLVFLHDQVKKDQPWMCAPEIATELKREVDLDTGSGAEDSDENDANNDRSTDDSQPFSDTRGGQA